MSSLAARETAIVPATLRDQVKAALKVFRASWVDLGRLLIDVAYGGDYKDWGYDDMEVYCARELGLKKPTVQKLMVSYNYMRKYEQHRLDLIDEGGPDAAAVPDYQTVELLDRVRRVDQAPEEEIDKLHERVFSDLTSDGEKELRQELKQRLKPAAEAAANIDTGKARRQARSQLLSTSREFRRRLSMCSFFIPGGLLERLEMAHVELESLE